MADETAGGGNQGDGGNQGARRQDPGRRPTSVEWITTGDPKEMAAERQQSESTAKEIADKVVDPLESALKDIKDAVVTTMEKAFSEILATLKSQDKTQKEQADGTQSVSIEQDASKPIPVSVVGAAPSTPSQPAQQPASEPKDQKDQTEPVIEVGGDKSSPAETRRVAAAFGQTVDLEQQVSRNIVEITKFFQRIEENRSNLENVIKNSFDSQIVILASFQNVILDMKRVMQDLFGRLTSFIANFSTGQFGFDYLRDTFKTSQEMAERHMGGIIDVFENIVSTGPDLVNTFEAITDNYKSGGRAFMSSGMDMLQYGEALKRGRDLLNDRIDADSNLDVDGQSSLIQGVYDQLVRQGIRDSIDSENVADIAALQLASLREVSRATGASLKELIKANEKNVTVDEAVARGFLNQNQASTAKSLDVVLRKAGATEIADMMAKLMMNDGDLGLAFRDDPQKINVYGSLLSQLYGVIKDGNLEQADTIINGFREGLDARGYGNLKGEIGKIVGIGDTTIGTLNEVSKRLAAEREAKNEPEMWAERQYNGLMRFFNDNSYFKGVVAIGSLLAGGVNWAKTLFGAGDPMEQHTAAMKLHSAAMIANSGGLLGKLGGFASTVGKLTVGLAAWGSAMYSASDAFNITDEERAAYGGEGWGVVMGQFFEDFGGILVGGLALVISGFAAWPATLAVAIYEGLDWLTDGAISNIFGNIGRAIFSALEDVWDGFRNSWLGRRIGIDDATRAADAASEATYWNTQTYIREIAKTAETVANTAQQTTAAASATNGNAWVEKLTSIMEEASDHLAKIKDHTKKSPTFAST